ncbi:hypothetical protein LI954_15275 [Enterococcus sp. CWB-B31]|nr:hypothetical protein [Enterococcus sp. CWB-B31]
MRRVTAGVKVFSSETQVGIIYSDKSIVVIYDTKKDDPKIVMEHYS